MKKDVHMQEQLTPKEQEVCDLLIAGRSPKEIALTLNVSYDTVKTHRKNLYRKLGVNSFKQLYAKCTNNAVSVNKPVKKPPVKLIAIGAGSVILAAAALLLYFAPWKTYYIPGFDIWVPFNDENSTVTQVFTTEIIDGKKVECITIFGVLYDDPNTLMTERGYWGPAPLAGTYGDPDDATNQILHKIKAISFKVLGDGGDYFFRLPTYDTFNEDHWLHIFSTVNGEVVSVTVNIPEDLVRHGWSGVEAEHILSRITTFQFQPVRAGPYNLKFWDIKIHF